MKVKNNIIINCSYCKGEGLISLIKCVNYDCLKANTCFRMICDIDNYWQAFNHYDEIDCKHYIKSTDEDIQKAKQVNVITSTGRLSRHRLLVQYGKQDNKRELHN
jgi:hypothetical protein